MIFPNSPVSLGLLVNILTALVLDSLKIEGFSLIVSLIFDYSFCFVVGTVVLVIWSDAGVWFWVNKFSLIDYFGFSIWGFWFENRLLDKVLNAFKAGF